MQAIPVLTMVFTVTSGCTRQRTFRFWRRRIRKATPAARIRWGYTDDTEHPTGRRLRAAVASGTRACDPAALDRNLRLLYRCRTRFLDTTQRILAEPGQRGTHHPAGRPRLLEAPFAYPTQKDCALRSCHPR